MGPQDTVADGRWVLLSGGVGGAKLALGLDRVLPPGTLTVIVNTGDDFSHLGLAISPDLDTLMYTLGGVVNAEAGWGRRDETWSFMAALAEIGGETWFRLGDRDLATHVERTRRLAAGQSLSEVTRSLCARLGIASAIVPMSDAPVRTRVITPEGELDFQRYFVRERAVPGVTSLRYAGAAQAAPADAAAAALANPALRGIVIAPSNPWLSIEPVLAIPAIAQAVRTARVPVIAVSPIVAGAALKGPTAKIMTELGLTAGAADVARHYGDLLDGFILDDADAASAPDVEALGIRTLIAPIVMRSLDDRVALARRALTFAAKLNVTGGA